MSKIAGLETEWEEGTANDPVPRRRGLQGLLEKIIDERESDTAKVMAFADEFLPGCRLTWRSDQGIADFEPPSCRESFMRLRSLHSLPWRGRRLEVEFPLVFRERLVEERLALLRDFLDQLDQRQYRLRDLAQVEEENRQTVAMLIHNARNQVAGLAGVVEMIGAAESVEDIQRVKRFVDESRERFRQAVGDFAQVTDLAMRLALSDARFEPRSTPLSIEKLYLAVVRRYPAQLVLMENWNDSAAEVLVDSGLFQQILENMVVNAFKYGHPREFPLRIYFDVQAGRLQVCVEDRGEGFKQPADLLFELGYRGDQSERVAGHGLGLAFCKRMIERMGGNVFARNNDDGLGATFGFDLPIRTKKD